MNKVELIAADHKAKIGKSPANREPNIKEDTLFLEEGAVVGFYLKNPGERFSQLAKFCNQEFLSKRVPKSEMRRSSGMFNQQNEVKQFSTILGYVPPKAHMRRPYPSTSRVHAQKKAQMFIKGMHKLGKECEKIIADTSTDLYESHRQAMINTKEKWRFTELYTSSISNFNIAAPYHIDRGNVKNTVNAIVTKRAGSRGGYLHIPDYDAMIEQADGSLLVYPAWRNIHGVTEIITERKGGYRNSLIFYPLKTPENG